MRLKPPLAVLGAVSVAAGSVLFAWWWVEKRDASASGGRGEEAAAIEPDLPATDKDRAGASAGSKLPVVGAAETPPPPAIRPPPPEQRLAEVEAIIHGEGATPVKLIKAYADWANEPTALEARRVALAALAAQGPPLVRLSALTTAVSGATVAPEHDPLFAEAVKAAIGVWSPDNIQSGRDMMLAEANPRARQLLISSIAQYAATDRALAELSPSQKIGLRSDFIDIYHDQPAAQQHDMEAAVRASAGEHAADLLRGIATTN
ncbi:MAG: hypothetical protein ABJA82_01700 [Myxococcales bacterium]